MITTITEAELTANSNNLLTSAGVMTVLDDLENLSPEAESHQIITSVHPLDSEDFAGFQDSIYYSDGEVFISLKDAEVSADRLNILTGSGDSLAELESQKDYFTTEAQALEALAANYLKQAKDCRERAKNCQEKAREKFIEELQGLAAQMQVMLRKADSYGVEEKAHEILGSVLPFHRNSLSPEPDPHEGPPATPCKEDSTPNQIESEESSSSAEAFDDESDLNEQLTMQEIQELQENSEDEQSTSGAEPSRWTKDDWRTPNGEDQPVVDLVERALGGAIGLDPTADAQCLLPAQRHFTLADDCLKQTDWASLNGTVFMNPPYSEPLGFLEKLIEQIDLGHVREAIVLLPVRCTGNQGTGQIISQRATAQCIWNVGRIAFLGEDGTPKEKPNFDCCFIYFGNHPSRFINVFRSYGNVSLLQNPVGPAPAPESEFEENWRRCLVEDAQKGQHLCDYKTFQITYFFEVGDPPGLWKLCVIDKEKKEKFAWYINVENLAPSPSGFIDDSRTGWEWCFVQAKTHIDNLLSSRAKSEAEFQSLKSKRQAEELKELQKSFPLFQSAIANSEPVPASEPINESHQQPSPESEHPRLTKELEFANAAQASLWKDWFLQMIGEKINEKARVFRDKRSKLIRLENLTAREVAIISNFDLSKKNARDCTEAKEMWTAAESKARYSEMSDEELEHLASEYKKDLCGEDSHKYPF